MSLIKKASIKSQLLEVWSQVGPDDLGQEVLNHQPRQRSLPLRHLYTLIMAIMTPTKLYCRQEHKEIFRNSFFEDDDLVKTKVLSKFWNTFPTFHFRNNVLISEGVIIERRSSSSIKLIRAQQHGNRWKFFTGHQFLKNLSFCFQTS